MSKRWTDFEAKSKRFCILSWRLQNCTRKTTFRHQRKTFNEELYEKQQGLSSFGRTRSSLERISSGSAEHVSTGATAVAFLVMVVAASVSLGNDPATDLIAGLNPYSAFASFSNIDGSWQHHEQKHPSQQESCHFRHFDPCVDSSKKNTN